MTIQQAIKTVVAGYDDKFKQFRDKKGRGTSGYYCCDDIEAIWAAQHDTSEPYGVDEEWLGIRLNGEIVWAYASGCSCWSGDYEVKKVGGPKELKVFKFNHDKLPKDWEKAIIEFAKTGKQQNL